MFPKKLTQQAVSLPDWPVVETKYGKLRGVFREGAFVFRGVRYAKARRFRMPEEPDAWEGIREATVYAPVCSEISTMIPKDAFTVPHFWYPQSEHCQYLNIWTQAIDSSARRPVMVWIHGGGLEHGSALEIFSYDGEELSRFGNVVVVSVSHRVNVLGYCDLSEYGPEYANSGNLGTADLVAALKWVRDNIGAFGGDPDNVTLFGQSGGAGKILTLMQTPAADGLFHKVSLQSGVRWETEEVRHAEAAEKAELVLSCLGLTGETVHQIDTVPYYRLADAVTAANERYKQAHGGQRMVWTTMTDGEYYIGHPSNVGFRQETLAIPMLIGTCLGEFENNVIDPLKYQYGPKNLWSEETLKARMKQRYGDYAEAVEAAFRRAYPDQPAANAMYIDSRMRTAHVALALARAAAAGAAPVYNWLLTMELPADGGSTPWHNAEEPFVFHNAKYLESTYIPGETEKLQDAVCGAWTAFAYSGNPNHPGLKTWLPTGPEQIRTMLFDRDCTVRLDHDTQLMAVLWEAALHSVGSEGPLRGYGGSPRFEW